MHNKFKNSIFFIIYNWINLIFLKLDNYEWIDKLLLQFNDIKLLLELI